LINSIVFIYYFRELPTDLNYLVQTIYSGEDPRWKLANPSGTELIFKYRKAHNLIVFFYPVFRIRKFLGLPNLDPSINKLKKLEKKP